MTKPLDLAQIRAKLEGAQGPKFWRSLEEIAATPEFQDFLRHEFPENADQWGDRFSRRRFLQLMSASFALAGLAACTKQPDEKIVPYGEQPENLVPGKPLFFATCLPWRGYSRGAVVESHEGRPTKVEGNPLHPATPGGGSDAFMQASVLSLYDPERARVVTREGTISSWESFAAALAPALEAERASGGAGLRVLTGTVTSPTLSAQLQSLVRQFPEARWHAYDPVTRDAQRAGTRLAFGRDLDCHYRFDRADVVLSFDGDFLSGDPASVRYAFDLASRRRVRQNSRQMSRIYAAESTPSLVGAAADHRIALRSSEIEQLPRAIAGGIGLAVSGEEPGSLPGAALNWIAAATKDLAAHRGSGILIAGEGQPAPCQAAVHLLNHALGNAGKTIVYTDPVETAPGPQIDSLRELAADMRAGKVMILLVLGSNPVYTAPADLDFRGALENVRTTVRLGLSEDETSQWCHWNVPATHPLESWSDSRAFDGTVTIQQPLIAPLYQSKSEHEILSAVLGQPGRSSHDIVKEFWQGQRPGPGFDDFWGESLREGFVAGTQFPELAVSPVLKSLPELSGRPPARDSVEIVFRPDPTIWDGEAANNGWLQELPKPLTRLTWDNAALLSPAMAADLGIEQGDVVELSVGGRKIEAAAFPTPGHAEGSVTAHFGYGRTRAGTAGFGAGFNAYPLRVSAAPSFQTGLAVRKTGKRRALATTQHHATLDGRNLVRAAALPVFQKNPRFAQEMEENPEKSFSLYPAFPTELPSKEYAWGMSIDLNTCIGCGACVLACQAENNSPIVGKDQVLKGREMHWLRIDRYYTGEPASPETYFEPVLCMHCEKAPCEVVCPVGATVHSTEGLNEMVYNRCVGTRYCSNNCPYKVRRFNFLQYNDPGVASLKLLRNPNVTVRSRGVMEKCTYCVQRISAVRIEAEKRNAPVRDGEIRTACQQACPARAIVFGNIHDPESEVAKLKAEPLDYGLLTELNTRPRTTYLAKVWNPNPEIGESRG